MDIGNSKNYLGISIEKTIYAQLIQRTRLSEDKFESTRGLAQDYACWRAKWHPTGNLHTQYNAKDLNAFTHSVGASE